MRTLLALGNGHRPERRASDHLWPLRQGGKTVQGLIAGKFIMKYLIALFMIFSIVGCSKKDAKSSANETRIIATDLGKDSKYFSDLYGPKISEKHVSEYGFSLPAVGHLITLSGPFVTQQYSSGKLGVLVIFPEASSQAIWAKYTLPNPWTDDQIKAALAAYDNKWSSVIANQGVSGIGEGLMKAMMPARRLPHFRAIQACWLVKRWSTN